MGHYRNILAGILVALFVAITLIPGSEADSQGPKDLPGFKKLAHGVTSGTVTILDTKRIKIRNFKYDGAGPDVFFWVGKGERPNKDGRKIPDESGSLDKLKGYEGKDIELKLPSGVTIKDIDWISTWCKRYSTDFGHVIIPKNLNVPNY